MPDITTPFGKWDTDKFEQMDSVWLQTYLDNVFRLSIFIYGLSISVLFFTDQNYLIEILVSIMIIFSLIYSYYIIKTVGDVLLTRDNFSYFNIIFYYVETTCLLLLYFVLLYIYYQRIIKKKHKLEKKNINGEILKM